MAQRCNINLSLNTKAHVIYEIKKHGHPFMQLRQAELIILTKQRELHDLYIQQDNHLLSEQQMIYQLKYFNNFAIKGICFVLSKVFLLFGIVWNYSHKQQMISRQLDLLKLAQEDLRCFLNDINNELNTAIKLKEQIIKDNPYLENCSYQEMQDKISPIAFEQMLIEKLAAQILSAHAGLPESSGELLLGLSEEKRLEYIDKAYGMISLNQKSPAAQSLLSGEKN